MDQDQASDDFDDIDDNDLLIAEQNMKRKKSSTSPADPNPFKRLKSCTTPSSLDLAQDVLQDIWGFPSFKLQQETAITRLICGGSAAVIFPTGGGKSLVYQVPALCFDQYDKLCGREPGGGVTLVVSPLIALMKVRPWLLSDANR